MIINLAPWIIFIGFGFITTVLCNFCYKNGWRHGYDEGVFDGKAQVKKESEIAAKNEL